PLILSQRQLAQHYGGIRRQGIEVLIPIPDSPPRPQAAALATRYYEINLLPVSQQDHLRIRRVDPGGNQVAIARHDREVRDDQIPFDELNRLVIISPVDLEPNHVE